MQNPIFCYDTFSNVYMYVPFYTHPLSKTQLKVIFFQVSILDNSLSFDCYWTAEFMKNSDGNTFVHNA